jgi:diguanylate cyclase (GGDEF)-like protein
MPQFQTDSTSDQGQGLFSTAEIESLMRVEFDRARRHKFPLVLMRIAVDRLDQLHDLYGIDAKDEILRAVTQCLRDSMRDSDHLGMTSDDRFLAVFPHTTAETGQLLAKRLIASARKMRFDRDGRLLRISLSIGIANNKDAAASTFEVVLAVADDGLAVADAGGGDRFVETELYALHEKKRRRGGNGPEDAAIVINAAPHVLPAQPPPPSREELLARALLDKLMAQGFDFDALSTLEPNQIAAALRSFQDQKSQVQAGSDADKDRQVELLERRIAKLTDLLGITEEELKRVAAMKGIDLGMASIYRTVQGLSLDANQYERKREMMRTIFETNFHLRQQIGPLPPKQGAAGTEPGTGSAA